MYKSVLQQLNEWFNLQKKKDLKSSLISLLAVGFLLPLFCAWILTSPLTLQAFQYFLFLLLLYSTISHNGTLTVYSFLSHHFWILPPLWDNAIFNSVWCELLSLPWELGKQQYLIELHQGWKSRSELGKQRNHAPHLVLRFTQYPLIPCSK